jgi:hypothetical protein
MTYAKSGLITLSKGSEMPQLSNANESLAKRDRK